MIDDDGPFLARVTAPAPAVGSDPLFVTIHSFDGGRAEHGPCLWEPPAGGLPAVGEMCVVVRALEEDGEGEQTVVIAFDRDTSLESPPPPAAPTVEFSDEQLAQIRAQWQHQARLVAGNLTAGTNVAAPGIRVAWATTLNEIHFALGTAPVGGPVTIRVNRKRAGVTTPLETLVVVEAGTFVDSLVGLVHPLLAGDYLTFDVVSVGASTPGANLGVLLVAGNPEAATEVPPDTTPGVPTGAVVLDTFTGTDASELDVHTSESGATWSRHSGYTGSVNVGGNIVGNRLRPRTGGNVYGYACSQLAPSDAFEVTWKMRVGNNVANNHGGVFVRMKTGSNTGLNIRHRENTLWELVAINAGTSTVLHSVNVAYTNGDLLECRLQCRMVGLQPFYTLYVKPPAGSETQVFSQTTTAVELTRLFGVRAIASSTANAYELDDFTVRQLPLEAPSPTARLFDSDFDAMATGAIVYGSGLRFKAARIDGAGADCTRAITTEIARTGAKSLKIVMPPSSGGVSRFQLVANMPSGRNGTELYYGYSIRLGTDWDLDEVVDNGSYFLGGIGFRYIGDPRNGPGANIGGYEASGGPEFAVGLNLTSTAGKDRDHEKNFGKIQLATWMDVVLRVKWSTTGSGVYQAWKDGVLLGTYNGQTLGADLTFEMRMGLYQGSLISHTRTFYIDNFRVAQTFAAADPSV